MDLLPPPAFCEFRHLRPPRVGSDAAGVPGLEFRVAGAI
jgi:hypothetical protein